MYIRKICIFFLIIIMLIMSILTGCSNVISNDKLEASKGILDLTKWSAGEDLIKLDGQWEFYWNELIEPKEFSANDISCSNFIEVPRSWNKFIINNNTLTGDGYATYRLFIETTENERLCLKIPRIFTSYILWVNGEILASAGTVGKSRKNVIPQYLPQTASFEIKEGKNEIVVQVSNFYHRSGGILESIVLGSEKQILALRYKNIAYEILLFSCLMIIGLYHLALFFFRKKNTPPLYFGLFSIFVSLRTLLVGERFLIFLFPSFDWEIAHKIQTLIFYIGVPLLIMFFKSFFPDDFNNKIVNFIKMTGLGFGCLVILTPAKIFTLFNPAYQLFTLAVIVYVIFIFVKILIKKEEGIGLIIFGALASILTIINDIIFLSIWMNDNGLIFLRSFVKIGNLSSFGQLIFVFANSLVLAKRFSIALEKEEVVTSQLKEININLDNLVIRRTKDLVESRKEIEIQKLELEKTNRALQLLALKDPLTGLWNRRHYDDSLQIEWNRCLRFNNPISLMMIDIDYFKAYNDYYGHKAGDECLVKVAQMINNSFKRSSDLVTRYGGEEFVVITTGIDKNEVARKANLLRENIEDLKIPHKCSPINPYVTVSIGVAFIIPLMDNSPIDLFLDVDKALYKAKEDGRNKVKFWQQGKGEVQEKLQN